MKIDAISTHTPLNYTSRGGVGLIYRIFAAAFVILGLSTRASAEMRILISARECLRRHGAPFYNLPVDQWAEEMNNCLTRTHVTNLIKAGYCEIAVEVGSRHPSGLTIEHVRGALKACEWSDAIALADELPQGRDDALLEILDDLLDKKNFEPAIDMVVDLIRDESKKIEAHKSICFGLIKADRFEEALVEAKFIPGQNFEREVFNIADMSLVQHLKKVIEWGYLNPEARGSLGMLRLYSGDLAGVKEILSASDDQYIINFFLTSAIPAALADIRS